MLVSFVLGKAALREDEGQQAESFTRAFEDGLRLVAKSETDTATTAPFVINSGRTRTYHLPDRLRYADGWEG